MDILHPVVSTGLTQGSTYAFYLIFVDAYSPFACIYGIPDKTTACVVDAITTYQTDYGHIGNYGYLDIARIRADSGSQFTTAELKEFCRLAGIQLCLAAPKKQYQNHLVDRSWQTISSMACSMLIHAHLPDTFMFHALIYPCAICNLLPLKGMYHNGNVGTPYELFLYEKPNISHFRVFGCQVTACKWTLTGHTNGKQTERGIHGIFVRFDSSQKGYVFYAPGSRQLYISANILFDETFSTNITNTWKLHRDTLALCSISSSIPLCTTTLEHTGGVDDSVPTSAKHFTLVIEGKPPSNPPSSET
jgi:hypothetical protein